MTSPPWHTTWFETTHKDNIYDPQYTILHNNGQSSQDHLQRWEDQKTTTTTTWCSNDFINVDTTKNQFLSETINLINTSTRLPPWEDVRGGGRHKTTTTTTSSTGIPFRPHPNSIRIQRSNDTNDHHHRGRTAKINTNVEQLLHITKTNEQHQFKTMSKEIHHALTYNTLENTISLPTEMSWKGSDVQLLKSDVASQQSSRKPPWLLNSSNEIEQNRYAPTNSNSLNSNTNATVFYNTAIDEKDPSQFSDHSSSSRLDPVALLSVLASMGVSSEELEQVKQELELPEVQEMLNQMLMSSNDLGQSQEQSNHSLELQDITQEQQPSTNPFSLFQQTHKPFDVQVAQDIQDSPLSNSLPTPVSIVRLPRSKYHRPYRVPQRHDSGDSCHSRYSNQFNRSQNRRYENKLDKTLEWGHHQRFKTQNEKSRNASRTVLRIDHSVNDRREEKEEEEEGEIIDSIESDSLPSHKQSASHPVSSPVRLDQTQSDSYSSGDKASRGQTSSEPPARSEINCETASVSTLSEKLNVPNTSSPLPRKALTTCLYQNDRNSFPRPPSNTPFLTKIRSEIQRQNRFLKMPINMSRIGEMCATLSNPFNIDSGLPPPDISSRSDFISIVNIRPGLTQLWLRHCIVLDRLALTPLVTQQLTPSAQGYLIADSTASIVLCIENPNKKRYDGYVDPTQNRKRQCMSLPSSSPSPPPLYKKGQYELSPGDVVDITDVDTHWLNDKLVRHHKSNSIVI